MFATDDTIVAVATPPGRGGIGVVRLSGPRARDVAHALLDRAAPLAARHATFARLVESDRGDGAAAVRAVDHVVATWFAAPHSYTGDDVVEISGHGSPVLLHRVVELAIRAGARLAEPGEFTFRAYLAGRIDLVQAEAVADLAEAVTPLQARAAMDQLEGTLTAAIAAADATLFDLIARLEASLDFPEEGFHFITRDEAAAEIGRIRAVFDDLLARGRAGRLVREGRLVVILGRPNAGKSSLFNALVGSARAIVTEIPGTTRDVLTERVDIRGVPITLVDTAGLGESRDPIDPIEAEGVRRARQAQGVAALTAIVLDGSRQLSDIDHELLAGAGAGSSLIVINKTDLPAGWPRTELRVNGVPVIEVCALTGAGLEALREALTAELASREDVRDPPPISNIRHLALVAAARTAAVHAETGLAAGATEELVLADLADARQALEELTGKRAPDDLLRHIFARFCVGK
jgi:tRNA modification GTPase